MGELTNWFQDDVIDQYSFQCTIILFYRVFFCTNTCDFMFVPESLYCLVGGDISIMTLKMIEDILSLR